MFVDAGTDPARYSRQTGELLDKQFRCLRGGCDHHHTGGSLRLEVASQNFTEEYRFNLGVDWKF